MKKTEKATAVPPLSDDKAGSGQYDVGYGKPPAKHRFSKDNPGNWKKGPRKRRSVVADGIPITRSAGHSIATTIIEIANQPVKVRDGNGVQEIPAIKAVLQNLLKSALAGSRLAARDIAKFYHDANDTIRAENIEILKAFLDYQHGAELDLEFRRKYRLSIDGLLPHPDDIKINPLSGDVSVHGPMNKEQRAAFDPLCALRDDNQIDVSEAANRYRSVKSSKAKARALAEWHSAQAEWDWVNDRLPNSLKVELQDRSDAPGATKPGDTLGDGETRRRKGRRG